MPLTAFRSSAWFIGCGLIALACGGSVTETDRSDAGTAGSSGTDGSSSDAGGPTFDAGGPDASIDGGSFDAGGVDGGALDGGSFDSGAPDASDGGASDGGGDGGLLSEQQAVYDTWTLVAAHYCPLLEGCCAKEGLSYEESECRSAVLAERDVQVAHVPEQLALGLEFDEFGLGECLDQAIGDGELCSPGFPSHCRNFWIGHLSLGAPCKETVQCAKRTGEDVRCEKLNGQAICTSTFRAKEGESCEWTCTPYGVCSGGNIDSPRQGQCYQTDGLYCSQGKCKATTPLGAACTGADCAAHTTCVSDVCTADDAACGGDGTTPACPDGTCVSGACVPKLDDGADCNLNWECRSNSCGYAGCTSGPRPYWLNFCH